MLTHGHTRGRRRSPTYISWLSMLARCTYETHPRWPDYGGRGIQVTDRWRGRQGFTNFLADLGERPAGMTLDRINPDGDYEPANCKWSTLIEQRWNRRDMAHRSPDQPPVREIRRRSPPGPDLPF